MVNVGFLINKV